MKRDHFHTDDGVPVRRVLERPRQRPFDDQRLDAFIAWLAEHDRGSRNPPMLLPARHRAVTSL